MAINPLAARVDLRGLSLRLMAGRNLIECNPGFHCNLGASLSGKKNKISHEFGKVVQLYFLPVNNNNIKSHLLFLISRLSVSWYLAGFLHIFLQRALNFDKNSMEVSS